MPFPTCTWAPTQRVREERTRRADTGASGPARGENPHRASLPHAVARSLPSGVRKPECGDSTWALPGQKRGSAPGAGAGPGTQGTDCPPASGRQLISTVKPGNGNRPLTGGELPGPSTFPSPTTHLLIPYTDQEVTGEIPKSQDLGLAHSQCLPK